MDHPLEHSVLLPYWMLFPVFTSSGFGRWVFDSRSRNLLLLQSPFLVLLHLPCWLHHATMDSACLPRLHDDSCFLFPSLMQLFYMGGNYINHCLHLLVYSLEHLTRLRYGTLLLLLAALYNDGSYISRSPLWWPFFFLSPMQPFYLGGHLPDCHQQEHVLNLFACCIAYNQNHTSSIYFLHFSSFILVYIFYIK